MARKRRRRKARSSSPRRRRRSRARRVNPKRRRRYSRRRRNVAVNPRHRRRYRRSRRRNPGFGGIMNDVMNTGVPAIAGAFVANAIDAKFLSDKSALVRIGAKVAEAVAAGFFLRRRFPRAAPAFMAGIFATIGGDLGSMLGGGIPAGGKESTAKKVAELVAEDEHMGVLLTQEMRGMGIVIQGMGAASTQQLLEGYGNGMGAYTSQPVGYGDVEND